LLDVLAGDDQVRLIALSGVEKFLLIGNRLSELAAVLSRLNAGGDGKEHQHEDESDDGHTPEPRIPAVADDVRRQRFGTERYDEHRLASTSRHPSQLRIALLLRHPPTRQSKIRARKMRVSMTAM
jgi:hypothetical protein